MAYQFGSGVATITPVGVANPTPLNIGLLQELSIETSHSLKELHGQYADAIAIGAGTRKWSGKAKTARFSFNALNSMYFGAPTTTTLTIAVPSESHAYGATVTVTHASTFSQDLGVTNINGAMTRVASGPAVGQYSVNVATGVYTLAAGDSGNGPFLISYSYTMTGSTILSAIGEAHTCASTVTVSNAANFTQDQGVVYAATGIPLTRVSTPAAAGQYSVVQATGVYSFYTADVGAPMLFSYNYASASVGQDYVIQQTLIGQPLIWSLNVSGIDPTNGNFVTYQFYNCVTSKLSWGSKLEDFWTPEIDFSCFANAAGSVAGIYSFDKF